MTASLTRRARTAATTLSALALGALTVGAGVAGAHQPAPLPHTPQSLTNRILHTTVIGTGSSAPRANQFDYVTPSDHVSYLLTDQYSGPTENSISWEKETPKGGRQRLVNQVNIDPAQKQWSEASATVKAQPSPSLGIQSTGAQVRRAITEGHATERGTTKIARQTTEMLRLKPSTESVLDDTLYVDQSTDQPVVEVSHVRSGNGTLTITSNWLTASPQAVSRLESKPTIPSGYARINASANGTR